MARRPDGRSTHTHFSGKWCLGSIPSKKRPIKSNDRSYAMNDGCSVRLATSICVGVCVLWVTTTTTTARDWAQHSFIYHINWTTATMIKNIHLVVTHIRRKHFIAFTSLRFLSPATLHGDREIGTFVCNLYEAGHLGRCRWIDVNASESKPHQHAYYTCIQPACKTPISTLMKYIFRIYSHSNMSGMGLVDSPHAHISFCIRQIGRPTCVCVRA